METGSAEAQWEAWYSQYRPFLIALCYQMLGSLHDAEDIVQETFLLARAYAGCTIEHPKALLAKIAKNRCLDVMKSGRRRKERYAGTPLPEPLPTGEGIAAMDERMIRNDMLSIASFMLMERLNPIDRAVYVLREAFEWGYEDIARVVDRTEAACRKMYSRVRGKIALDADSASVSQPTGPFTACLYNALTEGNMEPFVRLLSQDVILYTDRGPGVQTAAKPIVSAEFVAVYLRGLLNITSRTLGPLRFELIRINGAPAILAEAKGELQGVVALDAKGPEVSRIYVFRNPSTLGAVAKAYGLRPFRA
ncbi:ECF RNA polymerase sigma factor SigJ [Paenibacillus solanacearum]|uniref:ECF RNA polymerase sigma factor SigJ n=1 Tax=Paenibacillus solanacearum TaxID=2048548 RepID=A0A916K4N4_9BACL|nr:sigma-70 family RNA polymerase sigma factor [Paenibacillus solanacearum]CAG7636818.1 ECF RNA polymerase sigma factor SigJ [Paenibacillus solanacearum]